MTAWKQVLHENFPEPDDLAMVPTEHNCSFAENFHCALELFIKKVLHEEKPQYCQYIYMMPGSNYNVKKKLATSPIKHPHQWEEMLHVSGLLPAGNIKTPGASLHVEWFYMIFHKSDRAEYVQSGQKLHDETLQTLAEYFQSIHKFCKNDRSLQHHQIKKIRAEAKRERCQELEEQCTRKLCHLADQHRSHRLHAQCNDSYHCQSCGFRKFPKLCDGGRCNDDKQDDKKDPPQRADKDFKPCHVHGKKCSTLVQRVPCQSAQPENILLP
jgi:hypothetical protein